MWASRLHVPSGLDVPNIEPNPCDQGREYAESKPNRYDTAELLNPGIGSGKRKRGMFPKTGRESLRAASIAQYLQFVLLAVNS